MISSTVLPRDLRGPTAKRVALAALTLAALTACGGKKWSEEKHGDFNLVLQKGGRNLGYAPSSGMKFLEVDGYRFKDLNKNGRLDVYEDWRRSFGDRAEDLAKQLSIEEIGD